jgi:hypothetical protein
MTQTAARPSVAPADHRIPPPDGKREPLKANVYERMQHANTQLVPLFPYYGPKAMVYSGALFRGGPGYDVGHFFHNNTVHEVAFVWGASNALLDTGRIMATPNLHGVNSFLRDPESPDSFMVVTICQRQTDGEVQTEQLIWKCGKCHEHLYTAEFSDAPSDEHDDRFPEFPTLNESVEPVASFNGDESIRTCSKCGYVTPPFPEDRWGWSQWAMQQRTVNDARNALLAAAAESAH